MSDLPDTTPPSLIIYPCEFPIKIMGSMQDGFADAIVALVTGFDPHFSADKLDMRPSTKGNYLSLTANVHATSRSQLDDLYRALTAHPMVKIVL